MSRRTTRGAPNGFLPALAALALAVLSPTADAGDPPAGLLRPLEALALAPAGLDLRIGQGTGDAGKSTRARVADAAPMAEADVEKLLSRLPAADANVKASEGLVLRPGTEPPPRTGEIIRTTFPPPPGAPPPPPPERVAQPLEILRWMPEGEVGHAREVTVVFNQAMIPLTSADEAAALAMPVHLTPQPPGRWSWLDTKTAQFRPDLRFPHSTTYAVEVPAGTRSMAGTTLAETKSFRFETPTLRIESSYPYSSSRRTWPTTVPVVLLFDQQVDAEAVLKHVKVTAGTAPLRVRLLSDDELAKAEETSRELKSFLAAPRKAGHMSWILALAPEHGSEFPKDATITTEIAAGATSSEGPNPTKAPLTAGFRTYAPLRIVEFGCYRTCGPEDAYSIRFNNTLDAAAFDDKQVGISPDMADFSARHSGDDTIQLQGTPRPRTIYDVKLSGAIRDVYGQTLGKEELRKWRVGDAEATFYGPSGLQVLEPAQPGKKPVLEVFSRGYDRLHVRLYRVEPADYDRFEGNAYRYFENTQQLQLEPPGTKVVDEFVSPVDSGDEVGITPIDLSAALQVSGFGHVLAIVVPEPRGEAWPIVAWLQSTHLGLDAAVDHEGLVVFANDLATGQPAAGVEVSIDGSGPAVRTDASGVASLPRDAAASRLRQVIARRGDDTTFVEAPEYSYGFDPPKKKLAWYVVDDRGTYRPGEEVTLKGWIRLVSDLKHGDVEAGTGVESLSYVVYDRQRVRLAEGKAVVSAGGSFDFRFRLPATPNLGAATVEMHSAGSGTSFSGASDVHTIDIREFRRPEYEVKASVTEGEVMLGDSPDVSVRAGYFSGGPLAQAPVKWTFTSRRATFVPPGHEDYQFGVVPSWMSGYYSGYGESTDDYGEDTDSSYSYGASSKTSSASGVTDSNGTHFVRLELPSARPAVPMQVEAEAEVQDVNRQAWRGETKLLVHPGELYVGVKLSESYVKKGSPMTVSVIGVDHEGRLVSGADIEVKAARQESRWDPATASYETRDVDPRRCYVTSGDEPATCTFDATEGGSYTVVATIVDSRGRPSQSEDSFWVTSYDTEPSLEVEQEKIDLRADRNEYAPGDTARISVALPFYPGEAVVTVRRSGVIDTQRLKLDAPATVEVAIGEDMLPNAFVQVDAVGSVPRKTAKGAPSKAPPRPAYATGQLELKVPPKVRTLDVRVEPAEASVAPAAETSLVVNVRDAAGAAVEGAEVAVFVVDEAILALGGHRLPHPIASFYPKRSKGTFDLHSREYVILKGQQDGEGGAYGEAAFAEEAPGGGMGPPPLFLRKDFNPLAAFFPSLVTGADGRVSASFKLPDNVTRYRIFAIAASGATRFGKGESTLTARLPLTARPSAPRFLNFGDVFELPVVLQNQTSRDATVRVALRTQNLALTAGAGREVTIPANDRVEVRFPAAAKLAGEAAFQVVAVGEAGSDAASIKLPVWTPATTEAFATYGVIDKGAVHQPIAVPDDIWKEFGGLDVTTSSTNLQSLTDAFLYLVTYPFDCGEQIASRMLAIVALQDVLTAFHAPDLPTPEALHARLTKDVTELAKKQKGDGGFVFWSKLSPSDPYLSIHATNALVRARARGVEVPEEVLANALKYVKNIGTGLASPYTSSMQQVLAAFALYTRSLAGDVDVEGARKLVEKAGGADKLPLDAAGWLLGAIAKEDLPERKALVRHLLNRVTETAGAAGFVSDYEDANRLLLSSSRRTDAVVLESLILADPDLDLIPRVVTGLLAHRKAGRWLNTQENVYVLLALDRYFRTYEKIEPDFVARLWLGSDYAGDHEFKGRTTESHEVSIPTREVASRSGQPLVIEKDGKGRLYYRAGMRFAPRSLSIGAADRGFVVERRYEGADDPSDVTRDAEGTWKIRLGTRVRIKVQAFNEARRYQVALVDPLPAGLEPIAPKATPGSTVVYGCFLDEDADFYRWWNPVWYDHQNLRDERAEAFTSLLWPGDHVYEYYARATTPGTFVVPPAKAEEMYMPETFGRSASTRVVVE